MRSVFGCSLVAALALAGMAVAQEARDPVPRNPNVRDPARTDRPAAETGRPVVRAEVARGSAASADQQIAALIHSCCKNQIEISKFAQERAHSEEVREFAAKMVREHSPGCEIMAKFAGQLAASDTRLDAVPGEPRAARPARVEGRVEGRDDAREERREGRDEAREERREGDAPEAREERREGRDQAREERREAEPRAAARPADRPVARALEGAEGEVRLRAGGDRPRPEIEVKLGRSAGGNLNWVAIHKQIANQCLASIKQELGGKEGAEFDKCFMGYQVGAHMQEIDSLKVLRSHATAELREQIDSEIEHATEHLQEAKQIAKQLEGKPAARVSSKPAEATETTKPE